MSTEIIIYTWELGEQSLSSDEAALLCARRYAHTYELPGILKLLCEDGIVTIARRDRGKPYYAGIPACMGRLQFSLSHSGSYGACAVHTEAVGLDVQEHRACDREAISRRFFHPAEYDYLKKNGFEPFYDIWAAKESYIKYTGKGLAGGLGSFTVVCDAGLAPSIGAAKLRYVDYSKGYSMCLCAEAIDSIVIEPL